MKFEEALPFLRAGKRIYFKRTGTYFKYAMQWDPIKTEAIEDLELSIYEVLFRDWEVENDFTA